MLLLAPPPPSGDSFLLLNVLAFEKCKEKRGIFFRDFGSLYSFKCVPKRETNQRGATSNEDDFIVPLFKYICQNV